MIGILHGYLLDGSGSNLWTRSVVRSLCERGSTVHLFCQEPHPEAHDFIAEAYRHSRDGASERFLSRDVPYPGRCIMHKPQLGDVLPVYVPDEYEEFSRVVPMVELADEEIADYLERNRAVVARVVEREGIAALHANHAVLQSVVAMEVEAGAGVPYAVMPHGSALEYAVKRDLRMHAFAAEAFERAGRIIVIGDEMRGRVEMLFPELPGLGAKMLDLNLGVDTRLFQPLPRARRGEAVERLVASLAGVPRGGNKEPDEDVEAKLAGVDWARDPVLLFVGRLIAAKGPQSVLAAFPRVLQRHPDARLVLVGHGPLREVLEAMVEALDAGDVATFRAHALAAGGGEDEDQSGLPSVERFLERLEATQDLDDWVAAARGRIAKRVLFTGYLVHEQLRHLFPACDVAVFPSLVREAGPLVFLEALASGVYPLGTDFGGMAASIAAVEAVAPEAGTGMRLRPGEDHLVDDIAAQASYALERPGAFVEPLRRLVEDRYDWRSVAARLESELEGMGAARR